MQQILCGFFTQIENAAKDMLCLPSDKRNCNGVEMFSWGWQHGLKYMTTLMK
jgi:hypothetical protein